MPFNKFFENRFFTELFNSQMSFTMSQARRLLAPLLQSSKRSSSIQATSRSLSKSRTLIVECRKLTTNRFRRSRSRKCCRRLTKQLESHWNWWKSQQFGRRTISGQMRLSSIFSSEMWVCEIIRAEKISEHIFSVHRTLPASRSRDGTTTFALRLRCLQKAEHNGYLWFWRKICCNSRN